MYVLTVGKLLLQKPEFITHQGTHTREKPKCSECGSLFPSIFSFQASETSYWRKIRMQ